MKTLISALLVWGGLATFILAAGAERGWVGALGITLMIIGVVVSYTKRDCP